MSIYERFERHADKIFADASARYLNEFHGKDKPRQAGALRSILPYIGHLCCIDVDDEACAEYKQDRLDGCGYFDKPAMAGTVNKEITTAMTVLNKACRVWRWIPSSPKILKVVGPTRKAYPLTWDEQARLFTELPTQWDRGAAIFAVNTGVRKAELFGLRWQDRVEIPSLGSFVFVLRDTKNGKDRAVICNSLARRAVRMQEENGSEFVFPSCQSIGRPRMVRQSGKVWTSAWRRAGLPGDPLIRKGIHNCRHTFGYRLRAAGVPAEDRAALMGHNNTSLVQHYAMPDLERLSAAAELVTKQRDSVVLR